MNIANVEGVMFIVPEPVRVFEIGRPIFVGFFKVQFMVSKLRHYWHLGQSRLILAEPPVEIIVPCFKPFVAIGIRIIAPSQKEIGFL